MTSSTIASSVEWRRTERVPDNDRRTADRGQYGRRVRGIVVDQVLARGPIGLAVAAEIEGPTVVSIAESFYRFEPTVAATGNPVQEQYGRRIGQARQRYREADRAVVDA